MLAANLLYLSTDEQYASLRIRKRYSMLCCLDIKAKLRNYVTVTTDTILCSRANKMCLENEPPRGSYEEDAQLELQ